MKIKFTKEQIENMIKLKESGSSNQAIANHYGCSEATIRRTIKNNSIGQITKIENEIKILQIKLDSIKENPNNSPKWINSIVTISGIEASGLKRINYFVVQYPDGVIKSVN